MIRVYTGPEGSGKTLAMTADAIAFYRKGGTVYGFPGYKIFDDHGKQMSIDMDIADWITFPEELNNTMICIDEMNNFFDAYRYNSVMTRLFGSLAQQRRKRNLYLFGTVQDFHWLPPRLRWLVHIVTSCWDLGYKYRNLERGTRVILRHCDMKGLHTGKPGKWSRPVMFKPKPYWKHYDTYAVVDAINAFTSVRIRGTQVELTRGQPDSPDGGPVLPPMPKYDVPADYLE